MEGVLILRNSSRKLKTVADNASLQNCAVSSENISKRIKFKTENLFYLKVNVRYSDRNELFTPKIVAPQTFVYFFLTTPSMLSLILSAPVYPVLLWGLLKRNSAPLLFQLHQPLRRKSLMAHGFLRWAG